MPVSADAATPLRRRYPPPGRPEPFWPAGLTVLVAIGLQLSFSHRLQVGPFWLIPGLEALLLAGLSLATPMQLEHEHRLRRRLAIAVTAFVSAANVASLVLLAHELLRTTHQIENGKGLIFSGVLIWLTNVLIFGLWYWELDRGGPGRRAAGHDGPPDFLFPQMTDDTIEPIDWRPQLLDYIYVSLTNSTAFSPTDTMPLSPLSKATMSVQSLAAVVTLGLIISRAVNIL